MDKKEVPVLLITGYLGSGKTTLLNQILSNKEGIKFAVIVNDIGEINIDAELIQRDGIVNKADDSLVALQNGCICCTLQNDLVQQIYELLKLERFDYFVIEASGVCDPAPIAKTLCTIPMLGVAYTRHGHLRLDNIVTVVDALRMREEFNNASDLVADKIEEEDIVNLLIQQIEFCNLILLNKVSEVNPEELRYIKDILHALQPKAEIIACDFARVDLKQLLNTHAFTFGGVSSSAGWMLEMGKPVGQDDVSATNEGGDKHSERGEHCHHPHHHHHGEGEADEYGISTFTYYRREPFDMGRFDDFISEHWPKNIIRAKGICYFTDTYDMSCVFEQSGSQKQISQLGPWYAALSEEDVAIAMRRDPDLQKTWNPKYGDRMQKLVFIGQHLDKQQLVLDLDACLEK